MDNAYYKLVEKLTILQDDLVRQILLEKGHDTPIARKIHSVIVENYEYYFLDHGTQDALFIVGFQLQEASPPQKQFCYKTSCSEDVQEAISSVIF